jgi:hypothetical protein
MERCLKKVLQRGHSKNGDIRLLAVAVNPPNVVAPSRPEDEAREMRRRVCGGCSSVEFETSHAKPLLGWIPKTL